MPIAKYGVLKGRAVEVRLGSGKNPHYQVRVVDEQTEYRIAVNVQSQDKSDVSYVINSHFRHPVCDALLEKAPGFHPLKSLPGGLALDYIRANLAEPRDFIPLPFNVPGPDNDLNEKIDHYMQRALSDEAAEIYAFGQKWGPESIRDKIFGFSPGNGIHDIHMNQGNGKGHRQEDGVWQDGGLILHYPSTDQWVGVFLKFQSQAWHTDDRTGHALEGVPGGIPSDTIPPGEPTGPDTLPTDELPDGMVRIVAALVNDVSSPEHETVTVLNTSPRAISLEGWKIADKEKNRFPLSGRLEPGAARNVAVEAPVALSNKGGIITLIDDRGRKVHGVSYTKSQASHPGWTLTF